MTFMNHFLLVDSSASSSSSLPDSSAFSAFLMALATFFKPSAIFLDFKFFSVFVLTAYLVFYFYCNFFDFTDGFSVSSSSASIDCGCQSRIHRAKWLIQGIDASCCDVVTTHSQYGQSDDDDSKFVL